jgi:hypothetical protein
MSDDVMSTDGALRVPSRDEVERHLDAARALGAARATWRSRTPSVVARNDSLVPGMLFIEGSRLLLRRLPSEVKVFMTVRGGLGAVGLTRQVASPPTSQAVGDPHLRKLSEVLDDNDVLEFHPRHSTSISRARLEHWRRRQRAFISQPERYALNRRARER